jgi:ATP-dependent Lon protease
VLGLDRGFYHRIDIHIHIPEGAIPKDGPSAGITLATALVSALTRSAVRNDLAMTGEITLRGRVLPIGGLKEKVLAAHRGGIKTILMPKDNAKDIEEIPPQIMKGITLIQIEHMDEVLKHALVLTDPDNFFKPGKGESDLDFLREPEPEPKVPMTPGEEDDTSVTTNLS